MIIVRTPLRLSFVGGGSDLKAFYEKKDGMVISSAIDKFVYVIVKERFDDKIYINYSKKEIVENVEEIQHDLVREAMRIAGMGNGVFRGWSRPREQLERGEWEMLCPECGEPGEWQWTPETHAAPPNAYAMAKYSQEMQALTFGKRYGIPSVALRYPIVQGPRQSFYNAYSGACRIFSLNYYFGKTPTLYEDGLQCRDFVNIHDVVRANVMALEDDRMDYGVFNVGGGRAYTVLEFAEIVKEQMSEVRGQRTEDRGQRSEDRGQRSEDRNRKSEVGDQKEASELPEAVVPGLYRFGDTRNACSDISRIRALGWEPQNSPEDSVREYVEWLYEQDNVEDILDYAMKMMKEMDVVRSADYAD